jgi:hypothetical protein
MGRIITTGVKHTSLLIDRKQREIEGVRVREFERES